MGWERVKGGVVGAFIANPDYRERLYSNLASSELNRSWQVFLMITQHGGSSRGFLLLTVS
ncbi:MAG: hypothetical protein ACL7AX_13150 [Candidatus Arsenophonus phytopathogenicus]